jgi:hypothetical protein
MELHIILNLLLQRIVPGSFYLESLHFYGKVLKSIACVALVRNGIRITIISNLSEQRKQMSL